jgi:transcriptional regulator with XRE-family HTH domain
MRSENSIIIATNLKNLRKAHGYSLREAGAQLGISHVNIHCYESLNDKWMMPSFPILERLAELYGCRIADFFIKGGSAARTQRLTGATLDDSIMVVNRHLANAGLQLRSVPMQLRKEANGE